MSRAVDNITNRLEKLEAIEQQTKLVRQLQKEYFALRKGNGRYPSKEARVVLKKCQEEEVRLDLLLDASTPLGDTDSEKEVGDE